jgi:hypothetical protein
MMKKKKKTSKTGRNAASLYPRKIADALELIGYGESVGPEVREGSARLA